MYLPGLGSSLPADTRVLPCLSLSPAPGEEGGAHSASLPVTADGAAKHLRGAGRCSTLGGGWRGHSPQPPLVLSSGGSTIPSRAPRRDQEPGERPGRRDRRNPQGDQSAPREGGAITQKPNLARPALSDSGDHQS